MSHGGKRENAGRKKAAHTIQAEKFRALLIASVVKESRPLIKSLIAQGKRGNVKALSEIFDRVLGRAPETLEVELGKVIIEVINTEIEKARKRIKQNGKDTTRRIKDNTGE
jgi:hypothetical protein